MQLYVQMFKRTNVQMESKMLWDDTHPLRDQNLQGTLSFFMQAIYFKIENVAFTLTVTFSTHNS